MSGTHVQNVSSVGVDMALSMSAWLTGAPVSDEPPPLLLSLPHVVRAAPSDTAPAAARNVRRLTAALMDWGVRMVELPSVGQD